jgi:hypothetical protein
MGRQNGRRPCDPNLFVAHHHLEAGGQARSIEHLFLAVLLLEAKKLGLIATRQGRVKARHPIRLMIGSTVAVLTTLFLGFGSSHVGVMR